ncbi:hypothetical protein JW948_18230 [bacterium]|nr:hypothetical protein [bacterium]
MKNASLILIVLMIVLPCAGQEQTLAGGEIHSGGFGGPAWKVTSLNGEAGILYGGRGGWIINHTFVIGGGGYHLMSDIRADRTDENGKPLYLSLNYGGFEMEYIHESDKLVHWTAHLFIGTGNVWLNTRDPDETVEDDRIYIVEPIANIEVNILKWLRLNIGAGYRLAMGVDLDDFSTSEISGVSSMLMLKFGNF